MKSKKVCKAKCCDGNNCALKPRLAGYCIRHFKMKILGGGRK